MKKLLCFFSTILSLTGCSYQNNYMEKSNLNYTEVIGEWDFVVQIDGGWYISTITFYDSKRCSQSVATSTGSGINLLANFECEYKIDDNRIKIDEFYYTYDESTQRIYEDNGASYIKLTDNPCQSIYSFCN